jgi:hypothetical protein
MGNGKHFKVLNVGSDPWFYFVLLEALKGQLGGFLPMAGSSALRIVELGGGLVKWKRRPLFMAFERVAPEAGFK